MGLDKILSAAPELVAIGFLGFGFITAVLAVWALIRYFNLSPEDAGKRPVGPYYGYLLFSFGVCCLGAFLQYQDADGLRDQLRTANEKLDRIKIIERECTEGDADDRWLCYETGLKGI